MRSSTILTLLGAALAVATPLAHEHLHKKAIVYDIVTDIVYVTVTEGETPPVTTVHVQETVFVDPVEATTSSSLSKVKSTSTTSTSQKPTSTIVPPPPPPPTTTSTPPPPPPTTTSTPPPPPPPTTTKAPPPATTQAFQVDVVTKAPVAAPVASSAPAASSDDSLSGTGVNNHNTCRASHSAEPVSWNETLAQFAAKTAATCVFAHDMTEGGGGYGQNIASQGSSSSTAWTSESALENAIISEWYSEQSLFSSLYGQPSPQESGGDFLHFTQIVWKNSLEIGCAVQACPQSNSIFPGLFAWFTVCNYFPQGNVEGEFGQNVLPS